MNDKDILDSISSNFTMRANVNCFVDAMRGNLIHNSRIIR